MRCLRNNMSGLENVKASREIRGDKVSTLMSRGWWKETFPKNGSRIKTYGRKKTLFSCKEKQRAEWKKLSSDFQIFWVAKLCHY
jgi:hypothetical protein